MFFGGGPGDGRLLYLAGGALAAVVLLVGLEGFPRGWAALLPLAALAGWSAVTIAWSALPDRSWDYANRGLAYVAFAFLGLFLARSRSAFAVGLGAVLGAVLVWSLLGKVSPAVADYGPPGVGRLRGSVGLWNQLALVADFALPLALWRRRVEGSLLAYVSLVALALTYSRGGIATALVVVAIWFLFDPDRYASARLLAGAAVPAAVIVGVAFALPGVTGNGESHDVRVHDGAVFGVVLLLGAAVAVLLRRLPLPRVRGRIAAAVAVAAVIAGGVVFALGASSGAVGNSSGRLASTSSNFRFTWWRQAVDGWQHHRLGGTGAGSFSITNLLYRRSYLDFTIEPHNLPLQFLTETGVVGLGLFALAVLALLWKARRSRGHELALALVLAAFLVHSLVDVDWDFVAVSAPAFLAAGALAGSVRPARGPAPLAALATAGAALLAFGALLLPWLGHRWSDDATFETHKAHAISLAKRARSVDPLLIEPLWALAIANYDKPAVALAYYDQAVKKQPRNPQTWLAAGQYALGVGCPRHAYPYLEKYTELDHYARPDEGADDYRRALRLVNSGTPTC